MTFAQRQISSLLNMLFGSININQIIKLSKFLNASDLPVVYFYHIICKNLQKIQKAV